MTKILTAPITIKNLGQVAYTDTLSQMQLFTQDRTDETPDEIWMLEHPPVFTLGQAGKKEHLLINSDIPVIHCDRGGQITYHGPGQIVIYLLIDLKRLKITIRPFVTLIEQSIINVLNKIGINGYSDRCAPGVYVDKAKICSLGLRVRKGCTYHGLALNYNMDLTPFSYINPCGFENLKITQISELNSHVTKEEIMNLLSLELTTQLINL